MEGEERDWKWEKGDEKMRREKAKGRDEEVWEVSEEVKAMLPNEDTSLPS